MLDVATIQELAAKLGYQQLKSEQLEVISNFLLGRDCYFSAPTGFGKSVLFQLAPILYDTLLNVNDSCVIVVVPTISLAVNACEKIRALRPDTAVVHLTKSSLQVAKDATYIFCSQESILDVDCGRRLLADITFSQRIKAFFIDEAHIVRAW